ncbi:MAG: acetylornithine transaminase [Deltaproteobacteria bacterium]|nr:acetylornithine transaminase [Deltaproteobacteria bacterium]
MNSDKTIKTADSVIAATYKRFPLVFSKGQGATLWNPEGRAYTDFIAGIAVCNLGHAHPAVAEALARQAEQLLHVSNLYYTVPQTQLAAWLVAHSFADRVFFCNSGAEANEAAIKLCRKYFSDKGQPERFRIIAMERSFHGRTMATLSATGQDKIKKGFDPVLEGFDFVPYNDIEALKAKLGKATAAVLLEPIQGEGGVRCPAPGYLGAVRELCDANGCLMVLDEVQTGMGRTGRLFAHEHYDTAPDVMTLAKALGNGLPIGAMLASEKVAAAFGAGAHATTFGGTPIVTAASLAVVTTMEREGIVERCRERGRYFKAKLERLAETHGVVEDVRGEGLLLGMKLNGDGDAVVNGCMEKGFLINCIQGSILRFAPPLIIEESEIDGLIACLDEILESV